MQTNFLDLDVLEELRLQEEIKNNKKLRIAKMVAVLGVIAFFVFIVPGVLGLISLPQSQGWEDFWVLFFLIIVVTGAIAMGYAANWPFSPFNTVYKDLQTKISEWNNILTTHKDLADVKVVSNTIIISYFDDNGILQTKTFSVDNVYTYDKDVLLVKGYSANGTYRIDCYKPYK